MLNKELKGKIIKIIRNASLWEDSSGWYSINKPTAEKLADALIEEGLAFDKTTATLAERTNAKTLTNKAQCYDEMKRRTEIAEKALATACYDIARTYHPNGPWEICQSRFIKEYKERAEKELAEEGE